MIYRLYRNIAVKLNDFYRVVRFKLLKKLGRAPEVNNLIVQDLEHKWR
jgi:hypothetical protein